MASAKSMEAGFRSTRTECSESEDRYNLQPVHGVPHSRQGAPPEYTASSSLSRLSRRVPSVFFPSIDFTSYCLPGGTFSDDQTTRTTTDPELTSSPPSLYAFLKEQIALPPKPVVRIKGTHIDYVYSWGTTRTDFDLTLDVMPLIMPTSETRPTCVNIKPNPADNGLADPLRSWVQRFCNDSAECNSLALERIVTNWNTEFLERKVRAAVLSTKYKGDLKITFPITNSKVVIAKQLPIMASSVRERSDTSGKQKWLGRSKALLEVADQTTAASSDDEMHAYCQIQAIWPYASSLCAAVSTSESNALFSTTTQYQYAVQSEQDWWHVWKEPIRNGVLAKKRGWVTAEDWKDVVLGQVQSAELKKSWGTSADDWHTFLKGINLKGSHRAAPDTL